ncbi:uracil-DNA glycosylase-like protein [Lipomyces japonicus]|uniref:uracil-DNA glycosylase-like protein n=1 Tax=Lipomyces japonicus TaxID=56871 RepID=UPI0034CDDFC8
MPSSISNGTTTAVKRKAATAAATGKTAKRTVPLTAFFAKKEVQASLPTTPVVTATVAAVNKDVTIVTPNSITTATTTTMTTTVKAGVAFDKNKWINGLTTEQRDLLQLEIATMEESWLAALHAEFTKPYFLKLKRFLMTEHTTGKQVILPPASDVYAWSRLTPLSSVTVVILGQDPYHNLNQAHGLAFSVLPPTRPPPSLQNIYKCLKKDFPDRDVTSSSGELTGWAKQGVLLLNTCLTVRAHQANSHAKQGWEEFTERIISVVAENRKNGVVFLAWGTPAGKRVDKITDKSNHYILKSVHPSPLSASRGFFDCQHFKKTNEWLTASYGNEAAIDW